MKFVLVRITLRNYPKTRDTLFFGGVFFFLGHGIWLMYESEDI